MYFLVQMAMVVGLGHSMGSLEREGHGGAGQLGRCGTRQLGTHTLHPVSDQRADRGVGESWEEKRVWVLHWWVRGHPSPPAWPAPRTSTASYLHVSGRELERAFFSPHGGSPKRAPSIKTSCPSSILVSCFTLENICRVSIFLTVGEKFSPVKKTT